jgi:hypothetical protein
VRRRRHPLALRRSSVVLGLVLALSAPAAAANAANAGPHGVAERATTAPGRVFVMGVDGGSWNVIDAMATAGELPHLSALMERGATARLATVEPVSSPVVWTSIATGRSPDSTGVTDFFATRLNIRVPTAYERLAADGVPVGLYDVLMTWPPPVLPAGFVIPGWLRRDDSVTPPDVWERAGVTPYVNEYDRARTTGDYLVRARADVARKPERFLALVGNFGTRVGAFTIYAPDMTSHRFWHAAHPEEFEGDGPDATEEERRAIADAYRGVDAAAGQIAAALAPEDTLIIVSDHGFRARADGLRNVWVTHGRDMLAADGLDPAHSGFSVLSSFGSLSLRVHPAADPTASALVERDALVDRLMAHLNSYKTVEGEPLFGIVEFLDGDGRAGAPPRPWLVRLRQTVVRWALWLFFDVQSRDRNHATVFGLPDDETLAGLWPDGEIEVAGRRMPIGQAFSRQVFSGEHDPTGIFIAAGGPIAAVAERGDVSVLDVAPLLFHLTGRGVPDDLEGRVPTEILSPAALAAAPPRRVAAESLPGLAAGMGAQDGPDAASDALVEKLRALGYVE